jgi:hypothetical protein
MRRTSTIFRVAFAEIFALAVLPLTPVLCAQTAPAPRATATESAPIAPIAIVPLDSKNPDAAAKVTGALEVSQGKAVIGASGTVTSGNQTTEVVLPHRGVLRVCASTTVKLAAGASATPGETSGLMMALDHGAVEMSFATARDTDILLTPDFRINMGSQGAAEVKVRLGPNGDTCVDNAGKNSPYVMVSSVFEGGDYRVQPGQRVMFQRGSLHEVVDNEKEPCGCPPPAPKGNEFPLAQSEGLAPTPKPAPGAPMQNTGSTQPIEPLVYNSADHAPQSAAEPTQAASATKPAVKKKSGFFGGIGKFFRHIFGGE